MIAQGYEGIRQIEAILAKSESAKKGLCTGLKKGCRDGIEDCESASDIFKVGRYGVGGSCSALSKYAWPARVARPRNGYSKAWFFALSIGQSGRAARPRDGYRACKNSVVARFFPVGLANANQNSGFHGKLTKPTQLLNI